MAQAPGQANFWRLGMLAVFLIGLLGPWTYTSDGLPPPEYCQEPDFVLGEHCVRRVSGMELFLFFLGAAISIPMGLVMGTQDPTGRAREFFGVFLFMSPCFPLITTVLQLRRETFGLRTLHGLAWGMVILLCLFIIWGNRNHFSMQVWGLWLSLAAAAGALVLEGVRSFSLRRRLGQNQSIQ